MKKKSRLVTFGCSNTFGQSLKDTLDQNLNPSNYAWPSNLAKLLNVECCNLAECGISNRKIWYKIVNSNFYKRDIVVILWTYSHRTSIIQNTENHIRLIPSYAHKKNAPDFGLYQLNKQYYKYFFNEYNLQQETFLLINHAKTYLDSIKVENYHFTFKRSYPAIFNALDLTGMPHWNRVDIKEIQFLNDFAIDREHPSKLAHEDFASKIYSIIKH